MNLKKVLSYLIGSLFLIFALFSIFNNDISTCIIGYIFMSLALLILPTFDMLSKLLNKKFSLGRKIALGITTFLFPLISLSNEHLEKEDLIAAIFLIIFIWGIFFVTNKNKNIDSNKKTMMDKSEKNDLFHKIYNSLVEKRNKKVLDEIEKEKYIIKKFEDLDVFTKHAIANMLGETKEKYNTFFNGEFPEINISSLILAFCKDTIDIKDADELKNLFGSLYYKKKIIKYFWKVSKYIKSRIKMASSNNISDIEKIYLQYIDIFSSNMGTYESIKFCLTVSTEKEEMEKYKNYSLDNIDYRYRDAFIYMIDLLASCTCIAKMIFVEEQVKQLNKNSEFYIMVFNMAKEIEDLNIIIEKTRPLYDEFYKSELGFIDDEVLYNMAITIIVNRLKNEDISEKDAKILDISENKYNNFDDFDQMMQEWLQELSKNNRNLEINKYIIYKTTNSIDISNFDLLIESLAKTNGYAKQYYSNVDYNNKISDKERYLKGEFDKEKKEMSEQYNLNNIVTGTQFELYLVNLFKDLGYKTKHNGKAGDQGADLILKRGDYVYAVQAKYYTGKLSNTPVQEITGALKYYNVNQGVVITNSEFTPGAKDLAKANNVILIDGKGLKKLVDFIFEGNNEEDVLQKFIK